MLNKDMFEFKTCGVLLTRLAVYKLSDHLVALGLCDTLERAVIQRRVHGSLESSKRIIGVIKFYSYTGRASLNKDMFEFYHISWDHLVALSLSDTLARCRPEAVMIEGG